MLLVPGPGEGGVDEGGLAALAVLRAMGLPQLVVLVPTDPGSLQAKAAAKKHASVELASQVGAALRRCAACLSEARGSQWDCLQLRRPWATKRAGLAVERCIDRRRSGHVQSPGTSRRADSKDRQNSQVAGEHKVFTADSADCAQLLRHLGEHRGSTPNWRRQRPSLMVEAAEFQPAAADAGGDAHGTLLLRCTPAASLHRLLPIICREYTGSGNIYVQPAGIAAASPGCHDSLDIGSIPPAAVAAGCSSGNTRIANQLLSRINL